MSDQPRINELLEAYRPGVDHLGDDAWELLRARLTEDPEMKDRAQAIQKHDRVIRTAMQAVAVPAGLAERLLASLPEVESRSAVSAEPAQALEPVNLPPVPAAAGRFGRRAWAIGMVGTAAAAVLLALGLWPRGPRDEGHVTADELARMVVAWENDDALASGWRDTSAQGLSSYPIALGDLKSPPLRVSAARSRDDLSLVAYDLRSSRGPAARLYVAYTGRTFAVPAIPGSLLRGLTGLRQGVAWQRGEYLYVVVFSSEEAAAGDFVQIRDVT
jgi:hypothetical protein